VISDLKLTKNHENRKKLSMIKFSTFYRVFLWKNSFLKIFHKNNYLFSSQVSKGTSSDHCASNGTKIMPMRLAVQEIQRAQGRQNARV
jgi:hypothetical protein